MARMTKLFALEPAAEVSGDVPAKVGGAPSPPGPADWPACGQCGRPMRFLFQLPHRPEALLDLAPARALLVFQCENPETACFPFDADSGGNRALAVLAGSPAAMKGGSAAQGPYPERGLSFAAAEEDSAALSIDVNGAGPEELERRERAMEAAPSSKVGGVPIWPQSEATPSCCAEPMRFVAQLHGDAFELSFGDGGTGFVFECAKRCASRFKFLSQGY